MSAMKLCYIAASFVVFEDKHQYCMRLRYLIDASVSFHFILHLPPQLHPSDSLTFCHILEDMVSYEYKVSKDLRVGPITSSD